MLWWFVLVLILVTANSVTSYANYKDKQLQVLERVVKECLESEDRYSCFADKAAIAVERSMNWDVPIFDGFKFRRNEEPVNLTEGRSLSGFNRLTNSLLNFFSTHSMSLSLFEGEGRALRQESVKDGGGGGGGGGGNKGGGGGGGGGMSGLGSLGINKKAIKREYKYMKYAFMVLLGIFGLTGPIVMKTLALIAGKALLASKAALLIVGGVALKKIFEHNDDHHEKSTVKVHHIPSHDHDEHDRLGYNYYYYNPYPYNTYGAS